MSYRAAGKGDLRGAIGAWRLPVYVACAVLLLFLLAPIVVIVPASFSAGAFLEYAPHSLSLRWYREIFHDPEWRDAFVLSVKITLAAAALATVLGTAAALAVARLARGRRWVRAGLLVPLVLPYVIYALGVFDFIYKVNVDAGSLLIVPGQACLAFPIVFVAVSAGIGGIDPALVRAASSLGARWPMVVWRIQVPLLRRHIAAAAIFALAFCFDEVVVALFLATPGSSTLPVQIYNSAQQTASPAIAAAGVMVMLAALGGLALVTTIMRAAR
jgi:putative spermidine/putrescine transport system permease protein